MCCEDNLVQSILIPFIFGIVMSIIILELLASFRHMEFLSELCLSYRPLA